jgi:hypothetical protein
MKNDLTREEGEGHDKTNYGTKQGDFGGRRSQN